MKNSKKKIIAKFSIIALLLSSVPFIGNANGIDNQKNKQSRELSGVTMTLIKDIKFPSYQKLITHEQILAHISAVDGGGNDISATLRIVESTIIPGVVGTYKIKVEATDVHGKKVEKEFLVRINEGAKTQYPTLTVVDKEFFTDYIVTYKDLLKDIKAFDLNKKQDITHKIRIINDTIVQGVAGTYKVTYSVTDSLRQTTTRFAYVTLKAPNESINDIMPSISINKTEYFLHDYVSDELLLRGVSAYDKSDGDISYKVKVVANNIVNGVEGIYDVVFEVIDSDGNKTTKNAKITIKDIAMKDIKGHWAEKSIVKFLQYNYIGGYSDNTFKPDKAITRAEFVSMFNRYFGLTKKSGKVFDDTKGHWAKDAIDIAVTNGVANGVSPTEFKPDLPIKREEASVMIANYLKIADNYTDKLNKYEDHEKVEYWARSSVEAILEKKYMTGYPDKTFRPKNYITRAEAIITIDRIKK